MFDSMPKTEFMKDNKGLLEKALTLALLAGLVVAGWYLLPYLIVIMQNLLWTIGLVVTAAISLKVILNKTLQRAVVLFIDNMAYRFEKFVIEQDPFSTAHNQIRLLKRVKAELESHVSNLKAALKRITTVIAQFFSGKTEALNMAKVAQEKNDKIKVGRYARTAERYQESIDRLTPIQETAKAIYSFQFEMLRLTEEQIAEMEEAVKIAFLEADIAEESRDAVRAAEAIMSGPARENFNRSMDAIAFKTSVAVGEVELFTDMMRPLLEAKSFENEAKTMAAVEKFKVWVQQDSALLSADAKQDILRSSTDHPEIFLTPPAQLTAAKPVVTMPQESVEETEDELRERRARADKFNLLDRR